MAKTPSKSLTLEPIANGFLITHETDEHHAFATLGEALGHVESKYGRKGKPSAAQTRKPASGSKPPVKKPSLVGKPVAPRKPSSNAAAKKPAPTASAISAIKP